MGCCKSKNLVDIERVSFISSRKSCSHHHQGPLTERQCYRLRQSWKGIEREIERTGVEVFIRLFEKHPHLKALFKNFSNLETERQMRDSQIFRFHTTLVMNSLDDCFRNFNDIDYVNKVLEDIKEFHKNFDGISHRYFWKIKEPFLDAVKLVLEDRYTESIHPVYVIAINHVLRMLSGVSDGDDSDHSRAQEELDIKSHTKEKSDNGKHLLPEQCKVDPFVSDFDIQEESVHDLPLIANASTYKKKRGGKRQSFKLSELGVPLTDIVHSAANDNK